MPERPPEGEKRWSESQRSCAADCLPLTEAKHYQRPPVSWESFGVEEAAELVAVAGAVPPACVGSAVLGGVSSRHNASHFQRYTKLSWWKTLNC